LARSALFSLLRDDQLEACPVAARVVDEGATVRLRRRARDRQPEPVPGLASAAREAVEEPALQLLRDTRPRILDGDAKVPVAVLRDDPDRRRSVTVRIRDEVRYHPVEHQGIDDGREIVRDL